MVGKRTHSGGGSIRRGQVSSSSDDETLPQKKTHWADRHETAVTDTPDA